MPEEAAQVGRHRLHDEATRTRRGTRRHTYKIKWPASAHALYVTINDIVRDGRRRPFEIFINTKNLEHYAWTVALTRMISAVFRRGGDVAFVAEELKAVFDPEGGRWMERALRSEPAGGDRRRHRAAHASNRFPDAGKSPVKPIWTAPSVSPLR